MIRSRRTGSAKNTAALLAAVFFACLPLGAAAQGAPFGPQDAAALGVDSVTLEAAQSEAGSRRPDLEAAVGPREIIVRFKSGRTLSETSRRQVHNRAGGQSIRRLRLVRDCDLVKVPPAASADALVRLYQADPSVLYAEPNYPVELASWPNDSLFGWQWALHNPSHPEGDSTADIGALEAWSAEGGSAGVVVAVADTGVDYLHTDIKGNMWPELGWDFTREDSDPMDDHGHGTHVAGIVAASGGDGFGTAGIAREAQIMALKVLDARGAGSSAAVAEAVAFATQNGADIINLSLGGSEFSQTLYDAVADSSALVVCAAGNGGTNNAAKPFYPASFDLSNVVSVASTDRHNKLSAFSNFGDTKVHLAAPGERILSCVPGAPYDAELRFFDAMDSLGAWNTHAYAHNPWDLDKVTSASPPFSAGHAPVGGYSPDEDSELFMKSPVSLTGADGAAVRFMARVETLPSSGNVQLLAEVGGDGKWLILETLSGSTLGAFRLYESDVSHLAGAEVRFGFRLAADGAGSGEGVWIDDFSVVARRSNPLAEYRGAHGYKSGTSMAAPHVAGVAALLKSYDQRLDTASLKEAILSSVQPLGSLSGKAITGGLLSASGALKYVIGPESLFDRAVPSDHPTIQAAIDAASPGDVIGVSPGAYTESLYVDTPVTIANADPGAGEIAIVSADTALPAVSIAADDVVFSGVSIAGAGAFAGIYANGYSGLTVEDCTISGATYGIYTYASSGNTITGCDITANDYGLYLLYSDNNTISGNTLSNRFYGAFLDQSKANAITGNAFASNPYAGLALYFNSDDNILVDNTLDANGFGAYLYQSAGNTFEASTFTNDYYGIFLEDADANTVTGCTIADNPYAGIALYSGADGNTVHDTGITANGFGLYSYASTGTTVSSSTLANTFYGIFLDASQATVTGSTIESNPYAGIALYFGSSASARDNRIANNGFGLYATASSGSTIAANDFLANLTHAYDDAVGTNAYSDTLGNHWDDWASPDDNADGIVDVPYEVPGGTCVDLLPRVAPYGH